MVKKSAIDVALEIIAPELTKPVISKDEKEWLKMREIRKKRTAETQDFDGYVKSLISRAFGDKGADSLHLSCALGLNHTAVWQWLEEQKIKMSYTEQNMKKHPLYKAFIKKFYDMDKLD